MKITSIETVPVRVGIDRRVGPVSEAKGFRLASDLLLVVVGTDCGIEGVGEVNGSPDWSGELQQGSKALIELHWKPRLLGEDPRRIRHCLEQLNKTYANPFAKAGIEMALLRILGKALNAPLFQILGGAVRDGQIPIRFPIMPVGPRESAEAARRMLAEGFRTMKLKVGRDPLAVDMERVRQVRDAVGPEIRLTVDANGGWSVNEAIRAAPQLEEYGVAFLEQPVHRRDWEGLSRVRRQIRLPVMADESVFTPQDALTCIRQEAADIISVYPGKNGGILGTLAIVAMAEAAGVHCALGSNMEWDIASSAMAHLAVAIPNIRVESYAADIIGGFLHVGHATKPPLTVQAGCVHVPQAAGLGVELDRESLNRAADSPPMLAPQQWLW